MAEDMSMNWAMFEHLVDGIVKRITKKYKCMLIITKGWLVPGYYLAKKLGIKDIRTVSLESYDSENKQWQIKEVGWECILADVYGDILVVDDITDSWATLQYVLDNIAPDADSVCIFKKEGTTVEPTYFGSVCKKEIWIKFPREKVLSFIKEYNGNN